MLLHSSGRIDLPIATLGPQGSDAYDIAISLSEQVVLCETFRASLETAKYQDCIALVACGCGGFELGAMDRWVDLHFEYGQSLKVLDLDIRPTRTMCAAIHRDAFQSPRCVGVHPATLFFAQKYFPDSAVATFNTKVDAVEACANRRVDACIGSLDVVRSHRSLLVLESFKAEMIWVLYGRAEIAHHLGQDHAYVY